MDYSNLFKNYRNYRYLSKLSQLLSIVGFAIDASLSGHSLSRYIDISMYRYTSILNLSKMITFGKIFYDFGRLLNTDHVFSVLRSLIVFKLFLAYFKYKHMNCARQNQINE